MLLYPGSRMLLPGGRYTYGSLSAEAALPFCDKRACAGQAARQDVG